MVTSGLGGYYPAGLVIGTVDEVRTDDGGLARDPGNWDDLIDGPLWPEDEPPKRRTTGRTGGRRESR